MEEITSLLVGSPLAGLPMLRNCTSRRASSWDRTGGNDDRLHIRPGEEAVLADVAGAGCIRHVWVTIACDEPDFLRKVVLRAWWDGEESPSINVPIGDFFGMGHAQTRNFTALPLQMSPEDGKAFNCWFPMPFASAARITATSECGKEDVLLYYYIDYQLYDRLPGGLGYFHSQWRRQNPCDGISDQDISNNEYLGGGFNTSGEGNYVILEAQGRGHYVGCNLNFHNLRQTEEWNWYGEGDDMIFVDGEPFPPSLHGTGTEDYFNTAWCPTQPYSAPYHGITMPGGPNWSGKISLYRFHIEDPMCFRESIRVTIEHGHNNHRSDDISSTAYWYQAEPHRHFDLQPVADRLPRPD
ncbi:MAG: glycoside hydrolase family 172 protein [Chloroflexia bacterium]